MRYAEKIALNGWSYVGERNRMPVYPALMALFYEDGMSREDFFRIGKYIGILIAVVVLFSSFIIFSRVASLFDSAVGTAVAAFTVFAYKAPYFQADILFYGISFVLFVLSLSLLRSLRFTTAAALGIVAGIGHLTKASVLPNVILVVVCLLLRLVLTVAQHIRQSSTKNFISALFANDALRHLLTGVIVITCYLLVIAPYILTSKQYFGSYFYNVNSTFYIWCDSWDEANLTREHGDRFHWPNLRPEETPSMSKYLREHDATEIVSRFIHGARDIQISMWSSYGYGPFIATYAIFLIAFLFNHQTRNYIQLADWSVLIPYLYAGLYLLCYLALYAWYTPIANGNRFILTLFLPIMLLFLKAQDFSRQQMMRIRILGRTFESTIVSRCVLLGLVVYVGVIFPQRISSMYGGH